MSESFLTPSRQAIALMPVFVAAPFLGVLASLVAVGWVHYFAGFPAGPLTTAQAMEIGTKSDYLALAHLICLVVSLVGLLGLLLSLPEAGGSWRQFSRPAVLRLGWFLLGLLLWWGVGRHYGAELSWLGD